MRGSSVYITWHWSDKRIYQFTGANVAFVFFAMSGFRPKMFTLGIEQYS